MPQLGRRCDERRLGVGDDECHLVGGQHRRGRHRDEPDRDRAKEEQGGIAGVAEAEQEAVARSHAGGEEPSADVADGEVEGFEGPLLRGLERRCRIVDHDEPGATGAPQRGRAEAVCREVEPVRGRLDLSAAELLTCHPLILA